MGSLTRVAPELPVPDVEAALDYYTGRLGFEVAAVMPERNYAIVERDDVALHLFRAAASEHTPVAIHVFATDLEDVFVDVESRGAHITQEIVQKPWGTREFRVADLAGNIIKFTGSAT